MENTDKTEKRRKFIINTVYYAIVITLVFLGLKYAVNWIMPFLLGFIIALSVKPSISALHKVTKINRKLCAVLVLIVDYALLILLIWGLGSTTFSFLKNLFTQLPNYYNESISPFFDRANAVIIDLASKVSPDTLNQFYGMFENVSDSIRDFIVNFSSSMVSWLAELTKSLPFFLISFIFTILSSVFISMDYYGITGFIKKQLPERVRTVISDAKEHFGKTVIGYLRAYSIILLMTFTELLIGLSILRIDNAVVIAILVAIADIFPVIGTGGILLPWAVIMLINNELVKGLGLIAIYVIILLVRNFTEPKIIGDQLGLNPIVTLVAIYLGYRLLGVIGMILLPITVTIVVGLHRSGKIKIWNE